MGAIQSAINQAITVSGLLYTQTGQYKAKQEEIAKNKAIESSEKELKEKSKAVGVTNKWLLEGDEEAGDGQKRLSIKAHKDLAEAAEKAFELNPTEETKERAIMARSLSDMASFIAESTNRKAPYDPQKAKQANLNVANRVNAMSEQKQSVANYMKLLKEDDNG